VSLANGYKCFVKDINQKALMKAHNTIHSYMTKLAKKKKISQYVNSSYCLVLLCFRFDRDLIMTRYEGVDNYDQFKSVDMVIEAVVEDMAVKHKVIKELEAVTFNSLVKHYNCIYSISRITALLLQIHRRCQLVKLQRRANAQKMYVSINVALFFNCTA
jgi:3-hydroxyacyl-CoA dehydrogenase